MKKRPSRFTFIMLSICSMLCLLFWLFACLFAVGQLYNTYDLKLYFTDAPVAVLITVALFAAFVGFLVAAIRTKKEE